MINKTMLQSMFELGMNISYSKFIHKKNNDAIMYTRQGVPLIDLNKTLINWNKFKNFYNILNKKDACIGIMLNEQLISRYSIEIGLKKNWKILPLSWKAGYLTNDSKENYELIIFFHLNKLDQQKGALETKKLGIPSAGFLSVDMSPEYVDYNIIANMSSKQAYDLFLLDLLKNK